MGAKTTHHSAGQGAVGAKTTHHSAGQGAAGAKTTHHSAEKGAAHLTNDKNEYFTFGQFSFFFFAL